MEFECNSTGIRFFLEILSERYTELFEKLEVREKDVVVPNDFVISYISSILVGTLDWWVSTSTQMSARDFAHLIIKLIYLPLFTRLKKY